MRKRILIVLIAVAIPSASCFAFKWQSIHAKYLVIGNGAAPPITHGADIGGFGGATIGGFGGENIGGLP